MMTAIQIVGCLLLFTFLVILWLVGMEGGGR